MAVWVCLCVFDTVVCVYIDMRVVCVWVGVRVGVYGCLSVWVYMWVCVVVMHVFSNVGI